MMVLGRLVLLTALVTSGTSEKPVASAHVRGPHGLEGWTLSWKVPEHGEQRYPATLVIARHGHVVQRFEGEPFVWTWMFVDDGKRVAYIAAPLHFASECVLRDVATGKVVANYDCYHEPPGANPPEWVKTLEAGSRMEPN